MTLFISMSYMGFTIIDGFDFHVYSYYNLISSGSAWGQHFTQILHSNTKKE